MKINRRTVIKSLAAAGAISAIRAEELLAQAQTPPVKVLFVALQHGWGIAGGSNQHIMADVTSPQGFNFPSGLEPFNRVKQYCVAVDGLMTMFHGGNAHDLSYADMLTCGVPMGIESSAFDSHMPMSTTPSLDWLLQQRNNKTAFRLSAGYHSWGVPYHPLSFSSNAVIQPFYTTAAAAKASLFSNAQPASSADQRIAQGVFNTIKAPSFANALSATEQAKITQYIAAMSAAETKYTAEAVSSTLTKPAVAGQSSMLDLDAYLEMVRVGFATGSTDTAVIGIGDVHNIDRFHETHAHFVTPTYWQTRTDFAEKIALFVESLATIPDGNGSLLDNTIIVLTGEVGDGTHTLFKKGHILFGGPRINPGRWIQPALIPSSGWGSMVRENISGGVSNTINPGFFAPGLDKVSSRTNADLLREVGNLAGLNLTQFGLPSQNKGSVL